jgi:Tol biopolymer transport system component
VVFISTRSGARRIWRTDTDGGNARQLTSDSPAALFISATDQWLVYGRVMAGKVALWKVTLEGGAPEHLSEEDAICPVVSPDGKQMAYLNGPTRKIAVVPFAGGAQIKTFNPPTAMGAGLMRWTTDGRALSYLVTRGDVSNIWNLPLDGSAPYPVTDFRSERIYWFDWSRDGRLALARGVMNRDVLMLSDVK